jgi:hypothetical protein
MRSNRLLAVGLLFPFLLPACGGDDGSIISGSNTFDESIDCLTGVEPKGKEADRPAVGIKVENSPDARPQSGLEKADLVYEERVEGGITRFMAIFHCGESKKVGPVRSGRFDDPKIANPFTNIIAASGANGIVAKEFKKQKMLFITEAKAKDAMFRDPPGSTDTHSLFANTEKLRKLVEKRDVSPPDVSWSYGELSGDSKNARSVKVQFTSSNVIEYRWKKGKWMRYEAGQPFMTASGGQIAVPNLLIQEVRVDNSKKIVDSAGNPSPDITLTGSGRAVLFRDGKAIQGKWTIEDEGDLASFTTKSGDAMTFDTGPIWIELVPSKKGEVEGLFSFR